MLALNYIIQVYPETAGHLTLVAPAYQIVMMRPPSAIVMTTKIALLHIPLLLKRTVVAHLKYTKHLLKTSSISWGEMLIASLLMCGTKWSSPLMAFSASDSSYSS